MNYLYKKINRKYRFVKYDKNWINKFKEIKFFLESIFNKNVLYIEHIGSTSIPGMSAKPIIDVLIVVSDINLFENEVNLMVKNGYKVARNYIGLEQ